MSDLTLRDRLVDLIEWAETDTYATSQPDGMARTTILATAILDAGWRPPARTVTTVEELDALPEGTMIRDSEGTVAENWDGTWHSTEGGCYGHEILALPATVFYEPKEDEVMDAQIIQFPTPEPSENLTCVHCGCEWWASAGIVVDADTGRVTGHALPLTCTECGEETK